MHMANQRIRILAVVSLSLFVVLQLYFIATHGDSFEQIISQRDPHLLIRVNDIQPSKDSTPLSTQTNIKETQSSETKRTYEIKVTKQENTNDIATKSLPLPTTPFKQEDCNTKIDITEKLNCINNKEIIRNKEKFGSLAKDGVIISMLAYGRPKVLRIVMEGLKQVKGIENSLLIISQDGNNSEVANIIDSIDFCPVIHLYFPYSPHLVKGKHPGVSPGDCEAGAKVQNMKQPISCFGKPDQYGTYRNPKYVSLKLHWWWMMNTVWDTLSVTSDFIGHLLYWEDDLLPSQESLNAMKALIKAKNSMCKHHLCDKIIGTNLIHRLGSDPDPNTWPENKITIGEAHQTGFGFNRTTWNRIKDVGNSFCEFDDYNWDLTLLRHVMRDWYPSTLQSVGHLSDLGCNGGLHSATGPCNEEEVAKHYLSIPHKIPDLSNPEFSEGGSRLGGGHFPGWGGFSDPRDHDLCKKFSSVPKRPDH